MVFTLACFTDTAKLTPSERNDIVASKNKKKIAPVDVNNLPTTENVEAKSEFPFKAFYEI